MKRLFWLDMEMTGLDVENEVIIEVAAIITDLNFHVLDTYHSVVKQPPYYLEKMDQWNKTHHQDSGLVSQIPQGKDPDNVEEDLLALHTKHFGNERIVLAGNSIYHDRAFINRHFKAFAQKLHYRMLDVTSWKVLMKFKYGIEIKKKDSHRALDDIMESIAEIQNYLLYFQPPPN